MFDQGLCAPQRNRMGHEPAGVGDGYGGRVATDHLECHHRSWARHLATEKPVGVAAGKAGKVHGVHATVCGQPLGDPLGAGLLSANAHRQGLQPAVQQVAGERMENAARDGSYPS